MANETKQFERFSKLAVEGGADGKVYLTDNGRRVFKVLFDRVSVAREGPGKKPGAPRYKWTPEIEAEIFKRLSEGERADPLRRDPCVAEFFRQRGRQAARG